jgi:hypothetical protein
VNRLLLIALLCATATVARAEYLFTWHGNSNLFQGSFELPDNGVNPGELDANGMINLSITSPDDSYSWNSSVSGDSDSVSFNSSNPPTLQAAGIGLVDTSSLDHLVGGTSELEEYAPFSGALLWSETGQWQMTYIPEPSTDALLALAAITWAIGRRRMFRTELFNSY